MRLTPTWHACKSSALLIAALTCGSCWPKNGGLVLAVSSLPSGTQRLQVSVFQNGQSISQHSFDSNIAGQATVSLGFRVPEDKLGQDLLFHVAAYNATCPIAEGSGSYNIAMAERVEQSLALTALEVFGPSNDAPMAQTLTAVHGSSASNVYAVAGDGRMVRWDGSCWSLIPDKDPKKPMMVPALNAVHAVSSDEAWAVGENASIVHYSGKVISRVPSLIQGMPITGRYEGVWQAAPNDVWFVGTNAPTNTACLLHHFNGTEIEDFSSLCLTGLGSPKIVDLTSIWGISGAGGPTLYAAGERNMNAAYAGSSVAALVVKNGAGPWQSIALNSTVASKAERANALFGVSKDEVVLGVNFANLIHYKSPGNLTGTEIPVNIGRTPAQDDLIAAISGDAQSNLFLLFANGTGQAIYRTHGALTPWSNLGSSLGSVNADDVRALWVPDSTGAFLVGRLYLATLKALP